MSTTPAAHENIDTSRGSDASIPPGISSAPLWRIFVVFFRTGLLTFGGGYSILPVLHYELVDRQHWLSGKDYTDVVSKATAIPGAVSVNTAFLCGRLLRGKKGSATAVLGMVIPSFTTMIIIAAFLFEYAQHPGVQRFMKGAAAAVAAQITYGVWLYARSAVRSVWVVLATIPLFVGGALLGMHPLLLVAAAILVGMPIVYWKARHQATTSSPESDYSKLME